MAKRAFEKKYGWITFEDENTIADDEPVILFRARDALLPKLLKVYLYFCELAGSPSDHLRWIDNAAVRVKEWQGKNKTKVPESANHPFTI